MKHYEYYAKHHCYRFYSLEFETLLIIDDHVDLTDTMINKLGTAIKSTVDKFLHTEIDDYDKDLDTMIFDAVTVVLDGKFNPSVYTIRLGKMEEYTND